MSAPKGGQDARFMAEAVRLGEAARGRSAPNPNVGCVIVSSKGQVVGRGATAPSGRPHAEAIALEQPPGDDGRPEEATVVGEPTCPEFRPGEAVGFLRMADALRRVPHPFVATETDGALDLPVDGRGIGAEVDVVPEVAVEQDVEDTAASDPSEERGEAEIDHDVGRTEQDLGVRRAARALGRVRRVVADDQEHPTDREGRRGVAHRWARNPDPADTTPAGAWPAAAPGPVGRECSRAGAAGIAGG